VWVKSETKQVGVKLGKKGWWSREKVGGGERVKWSKIGKNGLW